MVVPDIDLDKLVTLVNEHAGIPRRAAGLIGAGEHGDVAGRVYQVFAADTDAERAEALNGLLAAAAPAPVVDEHGAVQWHSGIDSPDELLAAGCGLALLAVVREDGWVRLRTCDGADCADAHLDRPGRQRRYCSQTCLNRARVRAYRERQRHHEE
ncbi:CGNR zinc finger domain-containing protein [Actinoplanes sp. TFC3]|uniref:CGNR zinc finger domain-containing protein n=1 Tax=Actinoplanes sp. TFC3 TaxID=1710355 RepID=UPI000834B1CB|nr:CGNR zinc finger domain-containing protein [Actinoplanes sp. TFC3]